MKCANDMLLCDRNIFELGDKDFLYLILHRLDKTSMMAKAIYVFIRNKMIGC